MSCKWYAGRWHFQAGGQSAGTGLDGQKSLPRTSVYKLTLFLFLFFYLGQSIIFLNLRSLYAVGVGRWRGLCCKNRLIHTAEV